MRLKNNAVNKGDMRGLFFIIKGQYDNNKGVSSFDPTDDTNTNWYMIMDNVVFNTFACGSNLDKMLKSLEVMIKRYKTKENYFKMLDTFTTEDYYRVHYLGERPYTEGQLHDMSGKGKRCRVSPVMKELYAKVFMSYGDFYSDIIEEVEDKAYSSGTFMTPLQKSKKVMKKLPLKTPKRKEVTQKETRTPILKRKHLWSDRKID